MIEKLQNNKIEIVHQIHSVFQLSYAVEAKLLNATDFPPLKRPLESYLKSDTMFFGYLENKELAGVIEIEYNNNYTDINSLVVHPTFFRRGIARKLLEFVFNTFDSKLFIVETGVDNGPATELYKKFGFKEVKQWNTDHGIRKIKFERKIKTKFPILKSERVILRQFLDSDLENVFKGLSHPDIIKYYGISFDSLEATKEQMIWFANLEKNETGIWWAVCSKDDGRFLGAGGLNDLSKKDKKAEIGFWLLPENWGKGFMTETMPLIINYAFNTIGLHRIEGFVETENVNCKKALAKLKFDMEGTMQDCEIKNEEFISLDIYSKIAGT